mgnify:CR=1 FL=1
MIRISYKVKLILAMTILILVVTGSSLYFSTRSVERYYAQLIERQFTELSQAYLQDQQNRLNRFARSLSEATVNPRLTAAFEIGFSDGFDRFYYDLSNELQPLLQRDIAGPASPVPFFRFIDFEGNYLTPPDSASNYLGIPAPVSEEWLAETFSPFATLPEQLAETKAGFFTLPTPDGESLYEVWIFPTFDGGGLFKGDLVFLQPWDAKSFQQEGSPTRSGIYFEDRFFGPTWENLPASDVEAYLRRNFSRDKQRTTSFNLATNAEGFTVFLSALPTYEGFSPSYQVTLFSLSEERRILARIQRTLLTVSGFVLAIGLLFALLFGQRFSRRIFNLVSGTRAIAAGNFDGRIEVKGGDEISVLGESFNRMAEDLALKEKYRSVLEKVTDASVAEQLTSGSIELGGEEREVSILFCDIRQFTPLTRSNSASEIVDLLNQHMTALTRVVHQHHGVVDKFVGDEIMALFGAPKAFGNDPELAVRCGIEMLRVREELNRGNPHALQIGIGIATGKVVAGCMGSEDRLNYTVIGNCVNLASRLCSNAPPGCLYTDPDTAACVSGIAFVEATPIQLKGYSHRVPVFTVEPSSHSAPQTNA